jgi:hypothetical protein
MVDNVVVDTRINQKLPIGVNITFPHLHCSEVSVDTVDSAGDNQVNVMGGLIKSSLNQEGNAVKGELSLAAGECKPCLEASDDEHKCCNTCEDLKKAYEDKGLSFYHIMDTAEQCKFAMGCRISGKVVVNKVSGNVHVALGHSAVKNGKHVHEFDLQDTAGFNTSHQIHSITFGEQIPGMRSQLDGIRKIVRHGTGMFHYYIKLVPTVYLSRWGETVFTNQYSVTDTSRNVQLKSGELSGLPGVFIVYDFSPFLMKKTERTKPWSYIFTSICAIIGGVFSIARLADVLLGVISSYLVK